MRLLNARTKEIGEFLPHDVPPYAALSHTWVNGEEPDFKSWDPAARPVTAGMQKIHSACEQALEDGLSYVWADTCCIDKSSSTELAEAINSMYGWYRGAKICYAYLSDFDSTVPESVSSDGQPRLEYLQTCRWWTRGWTLQELICPPDVKFFDKHWQHLFWRCKQFQMISKITGIDAVVLEQGLDFDTASVARKMFWASHRETTRPEDAAYCLLGIFGVSMSPFYGEGSEKAFLRLQNKILKQTDDQSLFAWRSSTHNNPESSRGLLADSPACFKDSGDVVPFVDHEADAPFSMTNKGLSIGIRLTRVWGQYYRAELCCRERGSRTKRLCVSLRRHSDKQQQYCRVRCHELVKVQGQGEVTSIFVTPLPYRFNNLLTAVPRLYLELRNGPEPPRRLLWVHPVLQTSVDEVSKDTEGLVKRKAPGHWIAIGAPLRWSLNAKPPTHGQVSLVGILAFDAAPYNSKQARKSIFTSRNDKNTSSYSSSSSGEPETLWVALGCQCQHGLCFDAFPASSLPFPAVRIGIMGPGGEGEHNHEYHPTHHPPRRKTKLDHNLAYIEANFRPHARHTVCVVYKEEKEETATPATPATPAADVSANSDRQRRLATVEINAEWVDEAWGTSCCVDVAIR